MSDLCWSGDGRPVKYRDQVTEMGYCMVCASSEITSTRNVNVQFVSDIVPIVLGERVHCWTVAEFYEGVGEVIGISEDIRFGGTPVNPAYLVRIDDQDEPLWFTPICLKRAGVMA